MSDTIARVHPNRLKGLEIGWANASLRRNPYNQRICPICSKTFERRGNRKSSGKNPPCCSKVCKSESQKLTALGFTHARRPKEGIKRNCKVCHCEFQKPKSQDSLYCSLKCRVSDPTVFDAISGGRHYNWKGGITRGNQTLRKSRTARQWRKIVLLRDKSTCLMCGFTATRYMRAHHVLPWAKYPQYRFLVGNGMTLCFWCHEYIHERN
jgi:hypothetical protein